MYLGQSAPFEYHFLQGQSTNQLWVNNYQTPFNNNYLTPAAKLGETDPAAAYAMLAPAFAKIQADATNFINSFQGVMKSSAQATIDGWKKDWPLIQGFLSRWAPQNAIVAAPAGMTQPTSTLDEGVPTITYPPSVVGGGLPGTGGPSYIPSAPSVNVSTGAGTDLSSMVGEYLPWIAGAAIVGFLVMSGGRRRQA